MRTNLRLALVTTFLAAVVWGTGPGCALMSKTTRGAVTAAADPLTDHPGPGAP
jgi:hypothetical protein